MRAGEERNIFPFVSTADCVFNSSVVYEFHVLKTFVTPLLADIRPAMPEYAMERRLLGFINRVHPMTAQHVPTTALVREFIGGGAFHV